MKKFFLFKSSGSGSENKKSSSKSIIDKDGHLVENGLNNHVKKTSLGHKTLFGKSRDQSVDHKILIAKSGFRRSHSFSQAAAIQESGLDRIDFSCSSGRSGSPFSVSSNDPKKPSNKYRKPKTERNEPDVFENANTFERRRASTSHASLQEFLGSSFSSSNSSNKIVDRYIDGEQQEGRSFGYDCSQRTHIGQGKEKSKRPSRALYTAPTSPAGSFTEKLKCHSFRDFIGTQRRVSTRDLAENGHDCESPRKIAKNVIERLSRCSSQQKISPEVGQNLHDPIKVEDIYGSSMDRRNSLTRQSTALDGCSIASREYDVDMLSSSLQRKMCVANSRADSSSVVDEDKKDAKLQTALKEASERAMFLSEEFEQQRFIFDSGSNESALLQKTKSLVEERMNLEFEVCSNLQAHITDRANTNADLGHLKTELSNRTLRLEREKNEIQVRLEKELDRRARDWSLKLEKYRSEEQRLRERVRDLAEQNVAIQREISVIKEREMENRNRMVHSDQQLNDQTLRLDELRKQNQDLKDNMVQLKEQYKAATEDQDCFRRNYVEKETECKDLHKSIIRLTRTTSEQEKTIGELRESLIQKVEGSVNNHTKKLQIEQIRLTGVEQALRKQVDSYKHEAESLKRENIELINRVNGLEQEGSSFTPKLDQEMQARILCLQKQGLSLLNESTQMCSKLQSIVKGKAQTVPDTQQVVDTIRNSLDRQFILEIDAKIKGFKRGLESLTRSLQTISVLLNQKANQATIDLQSNCSDNWQQYGIKSTSKEIIKWELKEEILLTNLLREKLHCKELELEQLQAELATAVRGNEILKCEVHNALDCLSVANHKARELEVQNIKKDEKLNEMQGEFQESTKELARSKALLQKVSEERDVMWEEVKQYSEKNMLLNSEVNVLKKKIEELDEDLLFKEGQISILKDSLGRKPFEMIQ